MARGVLTVIAAKIKKTMLFLFHLLGKKQKNHRKNQKSYKIKT